MENNQNVVNIDINYTSRYDDDNDVLAVISDDEWSSTSDESKSDYMVVFKKDKCNYTINPLINDKRSPYVYDERLEKLSEMIPECYVCFEKTIDYSPCKCKAPLCNECFIKIRKQVNFEKCTICRHNFIKSSINMINIYNPFFLDDELDNELDNTCPYCLRIDFIIKFILLLSYIILSSFLFGNLIVQNYLYDNTNINKEFTYNLLTFGFGLLASIVSLICMYTVYKLFIYFIQYCRYILY